MREVTLLFGRELHQEAALPERSTSIRTTDSYRAGPERKDAEFRKRSRWKEADEVSVRPEGPAEIE